MIMHFVEMQTLTGPTYGNIISGDNPPILNTVS